VADRDEKTKRGPDLFTLIAGIATLVVSGYVLTDGQMWLPEMNPTWVLAGGALLVGVLMLASSLRGGRRDK
jgi:hypothetical protein